MNEHRSGRVPDWQEKDSCEWNVFQKIAAKTRGIVTPGNIVSTAGLIAVFHGLYQFVNGNKLTGAIEIGAGFLADAVDGYAADSTGTKSPLGKNVDASFDKFKIGATLYALYVSDALPWYTVATVGAQNIANTIFTLTAIKRGIDMQPETAGKKTMWYQCGGMALSAFGYSIENNFVEVAGNAIAVCGTLYPGFKATNAYMQAAIGPVHNAIIESEQ